MDNAAYASLGWSEFVGSPPIPGWLAETTCYFEGGGCEGVTAFSLLHGVSMGDDLGNDFDWPSQLCSTQGHCSLDSPSRETSSTNFQKLHALPPPPLPNK
jgi:hypothetical protein